MMPGSPAAPAIARRLSFAMALFILAAAAARADNPVQPRPVTFEREQQIPALPEDVDDDSRQSAERGKRGSGEFVIVPLPSRSPLLGWTVTLPAMYFYRPPGIEDDERAWITGAMALYTEDGSWGAGLFHRMGLDDDKWRLMGAAVYADLDYRFFGIGGDPTTSIPINQTMRLFTAKALRRFSPRLYAGLQIVDSQSEIRLDVDNVPLPPDINLPDTGVDVDLTTIAPKIQYDSRDNEFYPTSGHFGEASVAIGREWLGGDRDYEKYEAEFNDYRSVSEAGVLATRIAAQYLGGDAPFFVYPAFGAGADLRGYDTGAYRDRFLFAAQAEYRHRFGRRWGAVAFGGVGTTAPGFAEWSKSLWSAGAGLRWVVAPKNNFSLRIDVARGRDETQFYVGLGEAY